MWRLKNKVDYTFKTGEFAWFTYKLKPSSLSDWHRVRILDLNFAVLSAAILIEGYSSPTVTHISSLHKKMYIK